MHVGRVNAGSVLSVDLGSYSHLGIVTGYDWHGGALVTSNSERRGGVYEEPIGSFACGRPIKIIVSPEREVAIEVVRRARAAIGTRWDLFRFNCEHLVEWAFGREPQSRQVQGWILLVVTLLSVGIAAASAR